MSKIEELLSRTVRKDGEAKKWIVVVGIVLGLLVALTGYLGIFIFSEPVLDNYLTNVSPHPKATLYAYSVYDNTSADYSNAVFFMGSSIAGAGFKTEKISPYLVESDTNVSLYNLQMPMDTPLMRSMEMQKIIDANPEMVIFGITYRDMADITWNNDRTVLVHDKLKVRNDSLYLYSENELQDITTVPKFDYKKTYLASAWGNALGISTTSSTDKLSVEGLKKQANTSSYLVWHPDITTEPTRYKEALLYNVETLQNAGIHVVIINMPISPILSDLISDETRQNYFDLLNQTGASWYDLETSYSFESFNDLMHMSNVGSDKFAPVVANIISKEVESGAIHYA